MTKVESAAGLVLAGCNSLIFIDGEVAGDPLESAALKAMRWEVDDKGEVKPKAKTDKREGGKEFKIRGGKVQKLEILHRHHFSSKLQRMSAIVKDGSGNTYVVVKGSPEAIGERVSSKDAKYDAKSMAMAKRGLRVIGLGYKSVNSSEIEALKKDRAMCECDLNFAGFIAFTCRVRKDTKAVLEQLTGGGMSVAMVTGDNLLTAAHVAKEVAICSGNDSNILILEESEGGQDMFWKSYENDERVVEFEASNVPNLAKAGKELCVTGKVLEKAYEYDSKTKDVLWYFKIFARMSPDAKETVIENLHGVGHLCLMCGDGANDVGALKQADVGVALLSGFGDLNVDKGEDGAKKAVTGDNPTAMISQQEVRERHRGGGRGGILHLLHSSNSLNHFVTARQDQSPARQGDQGQDQGDGHGP